MILLYITLLNSVAPELTSRVPHRRATHIQLTAFVPAQRRLRSARLPSRHSTSTAVAITINLEGAWSGRLKRLARNPNERRDSIYAFDDAERQQEGLVVGGKGGALVTLELGQTLGRGDEGVKRTSCSYVHPNPSAHFQGKLGVLELGQIRFNGLSDVEIRTRRGYRVSHVMYRDTGYGEVICLSLFGVRASLA